MIRLRSHHSSLSLPIRTCVLALAGLGVVAAPISAENAAVAPRIQTSGGKIVYVPLVELSQFRPAEVREDHTIDFSFLDDALRWMVVPMGPSLREGAPRRSARLGTRRIQGHESRFRLEGNRVAFSFFNRQLLSDLGEYRADLERVGSELDIARLPRNEQLAFWLNLHNVAVIEALGQQYPLTQPDSRTFGSNQAKLDDAKLVTIAGVELSPRDIREQIVYANWSDPKVMYGFWHGEIGGPTIQRLAFNGKNVNALLDASAKEFVNSLRGVEKFNGKLQVSELYQEAAPYYFPDDAALRSHLSSYANDDVKALMAKYQTTAYSPEYERDLADLSRGETFSVIDNLETDFDQTDGLPPRAVGIKVNWGMQVLWAERGRKIQKALKRGIPLGTVIVGDKEDDPVSEVQ